MAFCLMASSNAEPTPCPRAASLTKIPSIKSVPDCTGRSRRERTRPRQTDPIVPYVCRSDFRSPPMNEPRLVLNPATPIKVCSGVIAPIAYSGSATSLRNRSALLSGLKTGLSLPRNASQKSRTAVSRWSNGKPSTIVNAIPSLTPLIATRLHTRLDPRTNGAIPRL